MTDEKYLKALEAKIDQLEKELSDLDADIDRAISNYDIKEAELYGLQDVYAKEVDQGE